MTASYASDTEGATAWDRPIEADAPSHFRPDIEGLRAVAVLAVLAFHAGVPGAAGGFVGVDVFFVISGFLITGLLLREIDSTGRLHLKDFYARRARRLLPAALVVIIFTLALSWIVLSPLQRADVGVDAAAAALYVSNYRFAIASTDYFAADVAPSPLLHYWSLGVEEQFYLLWPALLLGATWAARRYLLVTLAAVGVASFAASVVITGVEAPVAFYSLWTRAWQLALGAVIAVYLMRRHPRLRPMVATVIGVSGLVLIGLAVATINPSVPYPGMAALVPAAGAAMVVLAGHGPSWTGFALARSPLRWLGRISYSLYLWHWPILILGTDLLALHDLWVRVLLALLAVLVADASTRWIEQPFRFRWPAAVAAGRTLALAAVASVVVAISTLLASGGIQTLARPASAAVSLPPADATPPELPPPLLSGPIPGDLQPPILEARNDRQYLEEAGCQPRITDPVATECVFGDASSGTEAIVIGDSHAAMWVPAMKAIAEQRGWRLITIVKPGCTPVAVTVWRPQLQRPLPECTAWRKDALARIAGHHPAVVFFASSLNYVIVDHGETREAGADVAAWRSGMIQVLRQLKASAERVIVMEETPHHPSDPLECLAANERIEECLSPLSQLIDPAYRELEASVVATAGVELFPTLDWLCQQTTCTPVMGNYIVYRNPGHLTATIALTLAPHLNWQLDHPR